MTSTWFRTLSGSGTVEAPNWAGITPVVVPLGLHRRGRFCLRWFALIETALPDRVTFSAVFRKPESETVGPVVTFSTGDFAPHCRTS